MDALPSDTSKGGKNRTRPHFSSVFSPQKFLYGLHAEPKQQTWWNSYSVKWYGWEIIAKWNPVFIKAPCISKFNNFICSWRKTIYKTTFRCTCIDFPFHKLIHNSAPALPFQSATENHQGKYEQICITPVHQEGSHPHGRIREESTSLLHQFSYSGK